MDLLGRLRAVRQYLRGSLWFLPTMAVTGAIVVAVILSRAVVAPRSRWEAILFAGGADGARGVLEVIAGSTITVTSVTFSITVVALVTASTLYSPRLLRLFMHDRGNKVVLSIFLATFAFSVLVLRTIRSGDQTFVPRVAVTFGLVMALASLAALVYFIHHVAQSIRVETIMGEVEESTIDSIDRNYGADGDRWLDEAPSPPPDAGVLVAKRSGLLQSVSAHELVRLANELDMVVMIRRAVGEQVIAGTAVGWAWSRVGSGTGEDPRLTDAADDALQLGSERTMQEDVAFGLRQLVDIGMKALSPAVNDPTTAVHSLEHLAVLMCRLARCRCGPKVHLDHDGVPRVVIPRSDFSQYLNQACGQLAVYAARDLTAVRGVLRLLEEVAQVATTDDVRHAVNEELERTLTLAETGLAHHTDREAAREAAAAVRASLAGEVPASSGYLL